MFVNAPAPCGNEVFIKSNLLVDNYTVEALCNCISDHFVPAVISRDASAKASRIICLEECGVGGDAVDFSEISITIPAFYHN